MSTGPSLSVTAATARTLSTTAWTISVSGVPISVTIRALDFVGNLATSYRGTLHFESGDGYAGLPGDYTFQAADAGAHNFSVILKIPGTQSLTVTDTTTGGLSTFLQVTIQPAGPAPQALAYVANALTTSAEYFTNIVTAAYWRYLYRLPDAGGLAHWVMTMQKGLTDEELETTFLSSAEYIQNHGGSGEAWVIGMYHDSRPGS